MSTLHRLNELKIFVEKTSGYYINLKSIYKYHKRSCRILFFPVLDLLAIGGLQPEIKEIQEKYIPDGLHPNNKGNAVIAHKLRIFLENM